MEIMVNGETRQLAEAATLAEALAAIDVTGQVAGIAVALNDTVVPKSKWQRTVLKSGDRIEIVHAVQGG